MKYLHMSILVVTLLLAVGCKDESAPKAPLIRPVKTIIAGEHLAGKQWVFAGIAEDALETDLSFRVSGKIVTFPGDKIGRKFSKGEVIARLDPTDYELAIREAKANLEQIRAGYVRADADVQRVRQLFTGQVMSRSELDQAEAEFKAYEARLNATSEKVDIVHKQLNYTRLQAPFDGWISSTKAHVHQNVAAGHAVVSLSAGTRMKIYVSVPDILISQIRKEGEVDVSFDALPDRILKGNVMEIGVSSTPGSTYPVKVYLDNRDKAIRSGMSGQVNFLGQATGTGRIFLPLEAVVGAPDGTRSVWVVDPATSTVISRPVSTGEVTSYGLEIIDGVKPGDVIVIRGVHHLKEGLKVRHLTNPLEG